MQTEAIQKKGKQNSNKGSRIGNLEKQGSRKKKTPDRLLKLLEKLLTQVCGPVMAPIVLSMADPESFLKRKDLMGLPWLLAFALRVDGWYLRIDNIWNKSNVMPESVKDRPTKDHEHIFLLSKKPRYFYDYESVKELRSAESIKKNGRQQLIVHQKENMPGRKETRPYSRRDWGCDYTSEYRNLRSVWRFPTASANREAHFATFPAELAERCIKAGTRLGDTVLDPFLGSGTTYKAAQDLGRKAIGIELNPANVEISLRKIGRNA